MGEDTPPWHQGADYALEQGGFPPAPVLVPFPVKVRFPFPPLLMPAPLADIDGNYFAITNRFLFLWSTVINSLLFWYWMVLANFAHISH